MRIHKSILSSLILALSMGSVTPALANASNGSLEKTFFDSRVPKTLSQYKELILKGLNVNSRDSAGKTPLMLVLEGKQSADTIAVVLLLLTKGADAKAVDKQGRSVISYAWSENQARLLMKYGANPRTVDSMGRNPLHYWAKTGAPEYVTFLLEMGIEPNRIDKMGRTPLMEAALSKDFWNMEALLGHGARVNLASGEHGPPIFKAVFNGQPVMVQFLIDNGANINVENPLNGQSPLMQAALQGNYQVCQLLLSKGAKIGALDFNRFTPLMYGALSLKSEVVSLLLRYGAKVNRVNKAGSNALMLAVQTAYKPKEALDVMRVLINAGIDVNHRDNRNLTALFYNRDYNAIKLLVESGADVNDTNQKGESLIFPIATEDILDYKMFFNFFIKQGGNVNILNQDYKTALDYAIENRQMDIADLLKANDGFTGKEL